MPPHISSQALHVAELGATSPAAFLRQWWQWQCAGLPDATGGGVLHYLWQCDAAPDWDDWHAQAHSMCWPDAANAPPAAWIDAALAQLRSLAWGLTPGAQHRLALASERLLLLISINDALCALKQAGGHFDAIALHPCVWLQPALAHNAQSPALLAQQLARRSRLHASLRAAAPAQAAQAALWQGALRSQGWQPDEGLAHTLRYRPHWQQARAQAAPAVPQPQQRQALIIGAGLAGAACAYSLVRRGWRATVLDAAAQPAGGASALPVGLAVPHTSADDTRISQISRAGLRCTLERARLLLQSNSQWAATGVLQHCIDGKSHLPRHWAAQAGSAHAQWSAPASAQHKAQAALQDQAVALWHACAAWIKPPALVRALLAGAQFMGGQEVRRLHRNAQGLWEAIDAQERVLASAPLLVLAAGYGSAALLQTASTHAGAHGAAPLPLNALRGQITWGWHHDTPAAQALPVFPVNGKGSMAAHLPADSGPERFWISGSTFTRGDTDSAVRAQDNAEVLNKLRHLLPSAAHALQDAFAKGGAHGWAGVRATLPDRLPAVGEIDAHALPHLHLCCGMGARGLALAMLCGELLAARLHAEPLPAAAALAAMLDARRFCPQPQHT